MNALITTTANGNFQVEFFIHNRRQGVCYFHSLQEATAWASKFTKIVKIKDTTLCA